MEQLLRLFKTIEITSKGERNASKEVLVKTISNGFVFSPAVVHNYSDAELMELSDMVTKEIGLSLREMNNAFHKSWAKVRDASIIQLIFEQLIHYMTTYGFENLSIHEENTSHPESVYIPKERLELPEIDIDKLTLNVINGYTKEEIKEKLLNLLASGIALKEDTVKDVVHVAKRAGITNHDVDSIKNREVKTSLCDHLGLFPKEPSEFLRYVIYKATGRTLLIKSAGVIELLKASVKEDIYELFMKYNNIYGLQELAKIFYRFKPIFLALKAERKMAPVINKIRKLAVTYHKPMKRDYLNEVTAMIKNNKIINKDELESCLDHANLFRKIRLAYALNFRAGDTSSILYKIRNGKGFATRFNFNEKELAERVLNVVLDSVSKDIENNVKGLRIFIPNHVKYTLPATEKQFTGNLPSGSSVTVPNNMIFGVHWKNIENHRIDLDLSLIDASGDKYGWDGRYRNSDRSILFSGDMTDAGGEHGATELFYVKKQQEERYLVLLNYFNYMEDVKVPFNIIVARKNLKDLKKNYMVDPADVLAISKTKADKKQKILGLIVSEMNHSTFYFSEINIGNTISSRNADYTEHSRKYLLQYHRNMIDLKNILLRAGSIITDDESECDLNLAPEKIERDTIISMLT